MTQRMRRLLRWGIGFLILLAFIAGSSVAAWATGRPQEFIIEWAAAAFGGVIVDVQGVQLVDRVHIDSLVIYPDKEARRNGDAFAEAEGVSVTLALFQERRIPGLHIDTLQFYISTREDNGNVEFLQTLLASDDAETDVSWIPESVRVDSLWTLYQDEVGSADLMGIEFDAAIDAEGVIEAKIHGTVANGLHLAMNTDDTTLNSTYESLEVDLAFNIDAVSADIRGTVEQLGIMEAKLDASVALDGEAPVVHVNSMAYDIFDSGWRALGTLQYREWYANVGMSEVLIEDATWTLDGKAYPSGTFSASVRGLDLNDELGTLYNGDIAIEELRLDGGETMTVQGQLRLNDDLVSLLDAHQSEDEQRAAITFEQWQKSSLVAVIPPDLRGWIEDLAFDVIQGTIGVQFTGDRFAVSGEVSSTSASGDAPVGLNVLLDGERGRVSGTTGELVLSLGEGRAFGKGDLSASGDYTGTLNVESMPLRPFALLAMGARLPEDISGVLDGTVRLNQPADSDTATITPEIKLTQLRQGGKDQPDVGISGEILVDTETRIATSDTVTVATPNDEIGIVLNESTYALDSGNFSSRLQFGVDLSWLDRVSDAGGLYGMVNGLGTIAGTEGVWNVNVEGTSEDIAYGDILLPYGSVMAFNGTMRVTEETLLTEFIDSTVTIDEGSRITIPKATYVDEVFSGSATFDSDLTVLVDMAYVDAVEAAVTGEASWEFGRESMIDWQTDGTITSLALPEAAGTASDVEFDLAGSYTDQFAGSGSIAAKGISASGATVHDTRGTLGFEDNVLVISDAKSTLFNGKLNSRVGVFVLNEGIPIRYDGEFERINLTQLTEEVQPPKTKMTGMANGRLEADYSIGDGLLGFRLEAFADTFFTINRSLIEEILASQSALKGLGESTANKTLAKFLGEAPQRPFDSARLDLLLVDEAIEGIAEMKSEKTDNYNGLNLTVQVSIDAAALAESLKMLENQENTELDF